MKADGADIAAAIEKYLVDSFLLSADELGADDSLIGSGVIDSTGAMEVVAFLEEQFGVEIDDEDLVPENLDSIAQLTRFVESKLHRPEDPPRP